MKKKTHWRCNRAIDARCTHPNLRLMQLEKAKILRRGRIRRAAEKGCKCPDNVPDIVVARLLDRSCAPSCLRSCAGASAADGLSSLIGSSCLEVGVFEPLNPQDGAPARHLRSFK